jgi:PAS domain S-box-containing protein
MGKKIELHNRLNNSIKKGVKTKPKISKNSGAKAKPAILRKNNSKVSKKDSQLSGEVLREQVLGNEDLIRKYIQTARLMIIAIDTEQKVTYINDMGCQLLNLEREKIIGLNWFDNFIPKDQRAQIKDVYKKIISGNLQPVEYFENTIIGGGGKEKLIAWHNSYIKNESGKLIGTWSSGEDITEKRVAEIALESRERQYRMLVETMHDGLSVQDENGIITYVNDRLCELLGYSRDELIGNPSLDFIDYGDHAFVRSHVDQGRQGLVNSFELSWVKKDGGRLFSIVSPRPVFDHNNEYRGMFAVITDISERKFHDEALKASEMNYRAIFNSVNDAIFVHDLASGAILDVNQRMCDIYACTPEEIKFFSVEGISSGEFPYNIERAAQYIKLAAAGEPQLFKWHAKDKHGRLFWVEVSLRHAMIGGKSRVLAVVRDITERILAEEALAESQRALSTLMSNLPGMAYRCRNDIDWTMEYVSDGCQALTGYPSFDIVENRKISYGQLVHPDDQAVVWRTVQKSIENKEQFHLLYRIYDASRQLKWVWEKGCGIYSKSGELMAVEGFITDITEHKQTQDALDQERQRLAVTLRSIGDGVITTDTGGRIVLINKVAESLTGWTQEEAIGKRLSEIFHIINEITREIADNPVEKVLKSGLIVGLANHTALIAKDGTEKSIADSGAPIRDLNGNVIGVVLVFREITETKKLQEALARAQRLETASMVASQVAHDFNNLLAPLIAYPEFIKQELDKDSPAIKYLEDVETSAQQMADINQQLLTLGRRSHYNLEPLNLNRIVEQAIKQIQPLPESLTLELDLSPDLMNIKGGDSQIFRAVLNLIINAREAMNNQGKISIKTENQYIDERRGKFNIVMRGEYVKLTISDTGTGISPDIQTKIFDPFFTTKTTEKKRGSGLGLSVVNAVVEEHSGFIDFESMASGGTVFYLYFPITRETIDVSGNENISGGAESILVVDDDKIQREVTVRLLQKLGYETESVESGEDAVEFLKSNPRDLLVLDMIMPQGIDGAEAYRKVLKHNPQQKAIIVSGYAESERVREALDLGAGAFVKKPLTMRSLALAVRKELDRIPAE